MNRLEPVAGFVTSVLEHQPWSLHPLGQGADEKVPSKMRCWKSEVRDWPCYEFLEILLEIWYLLQIRLSGNFRGNMVPPAEPLSGNGRNLWSSLRNLPPVASQRAAGEKILPQNSQILS